MARVLADEARTDRRAGSEKSFVLPALTLPPPADKSFVINRLALISRIFLRYEISRDTHFILYG